MTDRIMGVGVIGLGFIGRLHVQAYQRAAAAGFPCRLVAVCDADASKLSGDALSAGNLGHIAREHLFDPAEVHGFTNVDELLARPGIDLVSICTYTDTHVELALKALAAGKHVLVEKPVARSASEVQHLADAARESRMLCMPAMCMRFWPGWDWLREKITDQQFGNVLSATFQRLGTMPSWGGGFYADHSRSGGALLDLHIHDADFIHWCFGPPPPEAVFTSGSLTHLTTQYRYSNGPTHVTAEAAWDLAPSAGFRMKYLVNFEFATVEWDSMRTPPLMLHGAPCSHAIDLPQLTGYDGEVRHFVSAIAEGRRDLRATLDDAVEVMRMIEAEQRSLESRSIVAP
jgi:predicted dehydrogenase